MSSFKPVLPKAVNMEVISKFEGLDWDSPHKEDELLSYLMSVANHFFPDPDGWDSTLTWSFKYYYNKGKFFHQFTPEQYNERFHKELEGYNIDVEKFWYLLIFVYEFCYSTYKVGKKVEKTSARDEFNKAMEYLKTHKPSSLASFLSPREISITIRKKGEKAITISHFAAIKALIDWDAEFVDIDGEGDSRLVNFHGDSVDKGENIFAFHFDKFISWFLNERPEEIPFKNKVYLIEDLLVFTGIVKEEKLVPKKRTDKDYDRADWLKGIRESYKDSRGDVVSSIF